MWLLSPMFPSQAEVMSKWATPLVIPSNSPPSSVSYTGAVREIFGMDSVPMEPFSSAVSLGSV